jgi:hypothetical protein
MTTHPSVAEPLLLPVGQYFGTFYPTVGSTERYHNVRVAEQMHELDDARFGTWALLHGLPDQVEGRTWTRAAVRAAAATTGVADVDQALGWLLAGGLAAEVAPGTDTAVAFARSHQLVHRMLGLGNSAEEPWKYAIGFFDQPVISVTRSVYNLWEWGAGADSLWAACESLAAEELQLGGDDPATTDPAQMLTAFLGTIHHLLTTSVVYLQPRL